MHELQFRNRCSGTGKVRYGQARDSRFWKRILRIYGLRLGPWRASQPEAPGQVICFCGIGAQGHGRAETGTQTTGDSPPQLSMVGIAQRPSAGRGGGTAEDYKRPLQGFSWVGSRGPQLGPGSQGELCGLPSQSP